MASNWYETRDGHIVIDPEMVKKEFCPMCKEQHTYKCDNCPILKFISTFCDRCTLVKDLQSRIERTVAVLPSVPDMRRWLKDGKLTRSEDEMPGYLLKKIKGQRMMSFDTDSSI